MNEPIKIRKLPAKDRPLARRVRLWKIRMVQRGIYIACPPPGGYPRWPAHTTEQDLINYISSPVGQAQHVGYVCAWRIMNGEV
jgi:hypothetical protein